MVTIVSTHLSLPVTTAQEQLPTPVPDCLVPAAGSIILHTQMAFRHTVTRQEPSSLKLPVPVLLHLTRLILPAHPPVHRHGKENWVWSLQSMLRVALSSNNWVPLTTRATASMVASTAGSGWRSLTRQLKRLLPV